MEGLEYHRFIIQEGARPDGRGAATVASPNN